MDASGTARLIVSTDAKDSTADGKSGETPAPVRNNGQAARLAFCCRIRTSACRLIPQPAHDPLRNILNYGIYPAIYSMMGDV